MKAKLSLSLMFVLLCAASALAAGPGQAPMQAPMSQAPMKQAPMTQAPMSQAPGKGDYMTGSYYGGGFYGGGYSDCQPVAQVGCGGRRHHRHCGRRHRCHRRGC